MLDLGPEIETHWDELRGAYERVLKSGRFILGPEVTAFEAEVADFLNVPFALGVNSGTDALVIGLKALGIGNGDEVITTPFTFVATAEAICNAGATPRFVDVDLDSYNICPTAIGAAITSRTKAIMPVHVFGRPCDMNGVNEAIDGCDIKVIEDTAQGFGGYFGGQRLGTLGHVGAYSFFPSKNLGAFGDGGLIVTHDETTAILAKKLRSHGGRNKYLAEMLGYNSRLDEIQAAILRIKLPHVDDCNRRRRDVAEQYNAAFSGLELITVPNPEPNHIFHQYTVRVGRGQRDLLQQYLGDVGIQTAVYYPMPLHRFPPYRPSFETDLRNAETLAAEVLSLPIGPHLSSENLERVIDVISEFSTRS